MSDNPEKEFLLRPFTNILNMLNMESKKDFM